MEDGKKKPVMIAVIVVCLAGAGLITYTRHSGGGGGVEDIPDDEMVWIKCNNPDCKAEYQTGKKAYHKYMQEHANPLARSAPAMPCEKCSKNSVFIAEKCGNPDCGIVFFRNSVPNDHADRCPECGFSATQDSRDKRKKEMTGG